MIEQTPTEPVDDTERCISIITRGTLVATEARRQYSGQVLLVEDNAINQRVARRFLERLGCEVQVVGDGRQAIEAFERNTYTFILMDMQMPVMDGLEATRRIRELETGGTRRTPIVALTANAMMGTLERCLEAGMDDYLTKPLDISRLQDVLDRFMGRADGEAPAAAAASTAAAESPTAPTTPSARGSPTSPATTRSSSSSWSTRSCRAAKTRCRSCALPSSSTTLERSAARRTS